MTSPRWGQPQTPIIPASFVGQNVCMPTTYIEQLGASFLVPKDQMPKVQTDPSVYQQQALGMFEPATNTISFPTQTIYEIVAYHEFMHFLGQFRYGDALAIQREEHEVFQDHAQLFAEAHPYRPPNPGWCATCRSHGV